MKKPKKFEDLSLKSEFFSDLILVETSIHTENIIFGCEYCHQKFLVLKSGHTRPFDLVVRAGEHYFNKHWTVLKSYVIEEEPPLTISPKITYSSSGMGMTPSLTIPRGGIIYASTTSSRM